jgi:hypothetical protein
MPSVDWFSLKTVATLANLKSESALRQRIGRRAVLREQVGMVWRPTGLHLRALKQRGVVQTRAKEVMMLSRRCIEQVVPELDMRLLPTATEGDTFDDTLHASEKRCVESQVQGIEVQQKRLRPERMEASSADSCSIGGGDGWKHLWDKASSDTVAAHNNNPAAVWYPPLPPGPPPPLPPLPAGPPPTMVQEVPLVAEHTTHQAQVDTTDCDKDKCKDATQQAQAPPLTLAWKEALIATLVRVYTPLAKRNNVTRAALSIVRTGKAGKRSGTQNTRCTNGDLAKLRVFHEVEAPVEGMLGAVTRPQIREQKEAVWRVVAGKVGLLT